ncbi:MAG: MATE family efflux transporter, partial [Cellulomonadaceae bacterium]|nr:MATE family efflux transporter [Cellulomonadaceae bacterium]
PTRKILAFAVPLLLGNIFQQMYAFTDATVVGRLIGVDALAAVGSAGTVLFLVIGFSWGSSAGLTIPVSRAFGAGNLPQMRRYVAAGLLASTVIGVILTAVGVLFSHNLLVALRTPPEIIDGATRYLVVTFIGASATVAFNYVSAALRAVGDAKTPLVFLIASTLVNAGLVVLLVGWLGFGLGGAAAATIVAQGAAVVACVIVIIKKVPALRITRADLRVTAREMGETLRPGLQMGLQTSMLAVGVLALQFAVNGLGATTVAAFTAAVRVEGLVMMPLLSFGIAQVTFTAQNRGAQQWHRIRLGVFRLTLVAVGFAGLLGVTMWLLARPIASLFVGVHAHEVLGLVQTYFALMAAAYMVQGVKFVLRNTLQGLGVSSIPSMAVTAETLLRVVAALLLVGPLGFTGAVLAAPLAWLAALVIVVPAWLVQRRKLITQERADTGLRHLARTGEAHQLAA